MQTLPITLGILTRNSGKVLGSALASAEGRFAEILLCDGYSTDETSRIAHTYKAELLLQDKGYLDKDNRLIDFAGARNQILSQAQQPWIFFLDADEQLTPALLDELAEITHKDKPKPYLVPRRYLWHQREILYSTTYPNRQLRFFHKKTVARYERSVHERPVIQGGYETGTLQSHMLVPMDELHQLKSRWRRYIAIEVERKATLSFEQWLRISVNTMKSSLLYLLRLPNVLIRPPNTRLPLSYELARHRYNLDLIIALSKRVGAR